MIGTEITFRNLWRQYCAKPESGYSGMPAFARALSNVLARFRFRHASHVTFKQLISEEWSGGVRTFDDGAEPLEPTKIVGRNLPEIWKIPQPVIEPKIATFRNAVLLMNGTTLLSDGRCCFFDGSFASSESWRRPQKHNAKPPLLYADPATDYALIRRHFRCIDVPGRCFSTRSGMFGNFGHFVHDVLSRIYYEDLGAIVPGRDKVIAPEFQIPIQEILFRKVFEGYEIVQVPPHIALKVEELLLPANLCKRDSFNPAAIAALARRLRLILSPYAGKERRKVCVSRRDGKRNNSHGREFVNLEAYENMMRDFGYAIVTVSELEPEDQFALWANTTDIVGIHGAGLMNMIMMPYGGNYTEIASIDKPSQTGTTCPNWIVRCAMAAGHRVGGLANSPDSRGRFEIDLDRLEELLIDVS